MSLSHRRRKDVASKGVENMKESNQRADADVTRMGAVVRYALEVKEVRDGVREGLRTRGLLPTFSHERIVEVVKDHVARHGTNSTS